MDQTRTPGKGIRDMCTRHAKQVLIIRRRGHRLSVVSDNNAHGRSQCTSGSLKLDAEEDGRRAVGVAPCLTE